VRILSVIKCLPGVRLCTPTDLGSLDPAWLPAKRDRLFCAMTGLEFIDAAEFLVRVSAPTGAVGAVTRLESASHF